MTQTMLDDDKQYLAFFLTKVKARFIINLEHYAESGLKKHSEISDPIIGGVLILEAYRLIPLEETG